MHKASAAVLAAVGVLSLTVALWWWHCHDHWDAWQAFKRQFIQEDGRVIDFAARDRSTSEGQSYALFFALAADDRDTFSRILTWTQNNLAAGDLGQRLPAWLWGKQDGGGWGILDANPASDADLWIAYALLEAGEQWDRPDYADLGLQVLTLVSEQAVVELPALGAMLLPAPQGFKLEQDVWRFNPSYVPPFLFARLAQAQPDGPWAQISRNALTLLSNLGTKALAPDWYVYQSGSGVAPDTKTGPIGSYDAIRCYLWAGMWANHSRFLLEHLRDMQALVPVAKPPPEQVNILTGAVSGSAPPGFSAALLPYLQVLDARQRLTEQRAQVESALASGQALTYYDQVLLLFGLGWLQEQFRFDQHGGLEPDCRLCRLQN